MDTGLLTYFLAGALVCFAGTLPFGPVNLTVAKITVEKHYFRGFEVAFAASFVEIFQVLVAVWFGMVIATFLDNNIFFRVLVATAFMVLAVYLFRRRPREHLPVEEHYFGSEIKTGLLVAILNPQAVPFWLFALAAINEYTTVTFVGASLVWFLAGVFVGKLLALSGFILVSNYLKSHLKQSARLVNVMLAAVLLFIGISQWAKILLAA